jgi:hypothetical protein
VIVGCVRIVPDPGKSPPDGGHYRNFSHALSLE